MQWGLFVDFYLFIISFLAQNLVFFYLHIASEHFLSSETGRLVCQKLGDFLSFLVVVWFYSVSWWQKSGQFFSWENFAEKLIVTLFFADFCSRAVWRVPSWILVKFLTGKILVPAAAAGAGAGAAGASKIFAQNFKSENKKRVLDFFVYRCQLIWPLACTHKHIFIFVLYMQVYKTKYVCV